MTRRVWLPILCWLCAAPAAAQSDPQAQPPVLHEEIEPRVVGGPGMTFVGLSGFVDRFTSPDRVLPVNYTAQVDVTRFMTSRIAARFGVAGSGSSGGDDSEDLATGSGAPSLHAFGGAHFYFSPQSMVSLYVGGEYWAQLTQRAEADAGSIVGKGGIQAAISSRASLFVEGGYGVGLTKDDDGVMTRLLGTVGVRLRF